MSRDAQTVEIGDQVEDTTGERQNLELGGVEEQETRKVQKG